MWLSNLPLVGDFVILEPICQEHIEPLKEAVKDGTSWELWYANVPHPEEMDSYVNDAISAVSNDDICYVVRCKRTANVVGTTRYYNVDAVNKRAMIGYTWYAASVRRTPINTEAKYLLLANLFEQHQSIAVEFRTHFFNQASRNAIERLGAKLDGILRHHQVLADGSIRDTACYSIIASEWPAVRNNLMSKLSLYRQQQ